MNTRRVTATTNTARVGQDQARRAIERVRGQTADAALKLLRFNPSCACEPLHRLVSSAVADLRRSRPDLTGADLVVVGGQVGDGEEITRIRRHAHGTAGWITTRTTRIEVELAEVPADGG